MQSKDADECLMFSAPENIKQEKTVSKEIKQTKFQKEKSKQMKWKIIETKTELCN